MNIDILPDGYFVVVFNMLLGIISLIAGAVASLSGFGIGSLVTPYLALQTGIGIAVAAVGIAHFFGTSLRFWLWRKSVDRPTLLTFGLASAAGGLVGALLHSGLYNAVLTIIFSCLLILAGVMGLTGISETLRFTGMAAWIAGTLSGFFGGLVGNQGGIRSAAMLGSGLKRNAFIATSTGIALIVDLVRTPVYLFTQGAQLIRIWPLIAIATIGVLIGTELGAFLLDKIPERAFKRIVSGIILIIGIFLLLNR